MLGRKRNKQDKTSGENWTDKAAGKIAGAGIKLQTKFAKTMNRFISNMPGRKLKLLLFAFCFISGGFSVYLAANAIWGKDKEQPAIEVKPINIPRHYNKTGSEINESENYIPEELYGDIQEYKRYMDSLGQPIRPGLLDSIQILEQIYHSQKIK